MHEKLSKLERQIRSDLQYSLQRDKNFGFTEKIISNQIFVTNIYSKVPDFPNGIKSRPYNKNFNPIPNNENERNPN